MKKLSLIICFFTLIVSLTLADDVFFNQKKLAAVEIFNYTETLIADDLEELNAGRVIYLDLELIDLNIYLSGLRQLEIFTNSSSNKNFTSKKMIEEHAISSSLKAYENVLFGNYFQAHADLKNSYNGYKKLNDTNKIAQTEQNLSNLFTIQNKIDSAWLYNQNALKNYQSINQQKEVFTCLIRKANLLLLKNQPSNAENLIISKALPLSSKLESKQREMVCYYFLGKTYKQAKKYTQAKWFFIQSLTLAEKLKLTKARIQSHLQLAKIKNILKDHQLALKELTNAERLINPTLSIYKLDLSFEMAKTYSYFRRYKLSENYKSNYQNLKASYLVQIQ